MYKELLNVIIYIKNVKYTFSYIPDNQIPYITSHIENRTIVFSLTFDKF